MFYFVKTYFQIIEFLALANNFVICEKKIGRVGKFIHLELCKISF